MSNVGRYIIFEIERNKINLKNRGYVYARQNLELTGSQLKVSFMPMCHYKESLRFCLELSKTHF